MSISDVVISERAGKIRGRPAGGKKMPKYVWHHLCRYMLELVCFFLQILKKRMKNKKQAKKSLLSYLHACSFQFKKCFKAGETKIGPRKNTASLKQNYKFLVFIFFTCRRFWIIEQIELVLPLLQRGKQTIVKNGQHFFL